MVPGRRASDTAEQADTMGPAEAKAHAEAVLRYCHLRTGDPETAADLTAMGQGAETLSVTQTDAAGNTLTKPATAISQAATAATALRNAASAAASVSASPAAGAGAATVGFCCGSANRRPLWRVLVLQTHAPSLWAPPMRFVHNLSLSWHHTAHRAAQTRP